MSAKLTRRAHRWALEALVIQKFAIARVADALDVAWRTADHAVTAEGRRALIDDTTRFTGVEVIGIDDSPVAATSTWP